MWYVIQTFTGREEAVKQQIEQLVDEKAYDEVFVPRYRAMRKREGEWESYLSVLTPGYLIVDTSRAAYFESQLKSVPALTKVLGNDAGFVPLDRDGSAWLEAWTKRGHRVLEPSTGRIEKGRVKILSGPLFGQEGQIVKVNRRKRFAVLNMNIMGREKQVKVALEIIGEK